MFDKYIINKQYICKTVNIIIILCYVTLKSNVNNYSSKVLKFFPYF